MKRSLKRGPVLWALAITAFLCVAGFDYVRRTYGLTLLDGLSDPNEARALIAEMSEAQKQVHLWTTGILDVIFPLAYGGLFVGLAWRFFGSAGSLLALPGLAVVPIDLTEGVVQILALGGSEDVLVHKVWVTPLKFGLFIAAAVVAVAALGVALARFVRRRGERRSNSA